MLVAPISDDEMEVAINRISDITTPGVDGFGAKFFKTVWDVVKVDVINDVQELFAKEKLFKYVNSSLTTLIPKSHNATIVKDFRPISCSTTIYKIISKVMTNRQRKVLKSIIDDRDPISIKLALECFKEFSQSNGLDANPNKCKVYFGNVETSEQQIVARRTQLIKSVLFVIVNYWMQCIPIPKKVIKVVETVCRTFLLSGLEKASRKSYSLAKDPMDKMNTLLLYKRDKYNDCVYEEFLLLDPQGYIEKEWNHKSKCYIEQFDAARQI
ncbi:uncharacterized protein LOC131619289 [Vicia villosa]|uniref:uncharacterized protein LOC131619289 n=1 Tax=Vicia villosa TaxID=3911 RepID=UPI00273C1C6D|nr:uncharacterized protein LOC131619289 [Vicia villosa]